jgi:hypothetical protein
MSLVAAERLRGLVECFPSIAPATCLHMNDRRPQELQPAHARAIHGKKQVGQPADVVALILGRRCYYLSELLAGLEVDNSVHVAVGHHLCADLANRVRVKVDPAEENTRHRRWWRPRVCRGCGLSRPIAKHLNRERSSTFRAPSHQYSRAADCLASSTPVHTCGSWLFASPEWDCAQALPRTNARA